MMKKSILVIVLIALGATGFSPSRHDQRHEQTV